VSERAVQRAVAAWMREQGSFCSIPSRAPSPLIRRRQVIKTFPQKTFPGDLVSLSTADPNCVSVAYPSSYALARDETVALWLCKDGKSRQDWRSWSSALVSFDARPSPLRAYDCLPRQLALIHRPPPFSPRRISTPPTARLSSRTATRPREEDVAALPFLYLFPSLLHGAHLPPFLPPVFRACD
jgi:hypothetical protein